MVVQVVIRLTLYIDQFIIRANVGNTELRQGIDNTVRHLRHATFQFFLSCYRIQTKIYRRR